MNYPFFVTAVTTTESKVLLHSTHHRLPLYGFFLHDAESECALEFSESELGEMLPLRYGRLTQAH